MSWNYRIYKTVHPNDEETFGIHECYYYEDKETPRAVTERPVPVDADSVKGLRWILEQMLLALDKDVLTENDFQTTVEGARRDSVS